MQHPTVTETRSDPTTSQLASVAATPDRLIVGFADGRLRRYDRFWLRDNCPSNGDRASLFRSFSIASMADDLAIRRATLAAGAVRVEFSDGMIDEFGAPFLEQFADCDVAGDPCWTPWRAGNEPSAFVFADVTDRSAEHHRLVEAVARDGFAVVVGIPGDPDATEQIAAWLGPIRETDFGRVFDIVTEPDPFTPSQSGGALDPHTDDPYRYSPPGISVLHCVTPCSGDGGASVIVDGFAVAEAIRGDDPDAFDILTTVAVPYVHRRRESVEQGHDVHLRADAPIISLDAAGRISGIRFHERSMAPLRLPPDDAERCYRAVMRFARDVLGGGFAYERRLGAGEALVYDNQRVLHGRTAITGTRSRRHLRLCTVDRDQVHSRLRRLRERYAPGTECGPLTAGSSS